MKTLILTALLALPAAAAVPQELKTQLQNEAARLEQLAAAAPRDAEILMKLGLTYSRLEQADEAQRAFEAAVALAPGNAGAHYMLGLIYEKKALREKAVAAWRACLENASDPKMKETAARHLKQLSRP